MSGGEGGRGRTVAALLAGTAAATDDPAGQALALKRRLARAGWALERVEALRRAQKAADAAWARLVAPYDDWDEADVPELEAPPEQDEVDRIHAEIEAASRHDRWPRHLHWGDV